MKPIALILSLLCVSAGVRQKKPSEILMDLARRTPPKHEKLRTATKAAASASIVPLPMPAATRPVTRALVARPAVTNVSISWSCSLDWLGGEDTRSGLDVRACLTNCLRTGLADFAGPVTNLAYAQSNRVTLPASKPSQLFRAFIGPKSK